MVARAWSSQQGVTSQYLWLPQERVMVLQGRTKASLSRSSLTPRRGAGRPGSNPGLVLTPHRASVFPICTVRVGPACQREKIHL